MRENEMGEMTRLVFEVDKETAEQIMTKGYTEFCNRGYKQRFKSFVKASIVQENPGEKSAKELLQRINQTSGTDRRMASQLSRCLSKVDYAAKKLDGVSTDLVNITGKMDSVFNLSKKIQTLSVVNTALSVANLAVDVAGFAIVLSKLRGLSNQMAVIYEQLSRVENKIDTLHGIAVADKLAEIDRLVLQYGRFADKIEHGEDLDYDQLYDFLASVKSVMAELIYWTNRRLADVGVLLDCIFTLLPVYTTILCVYLEHYYCKYREAPSCYDNFVGLFEDLHSKEFSDTLQDYYMLEQYLDYRDVVDLMNVLNGTVFSERLEIEDQMRLIDVFEDSKTYYAYKEKVSETAKQEAAKYYAEVVDELEKREIAERFAQLGKQFAK